MSEVDHPAHYNRGANTILEDGTALYEPIKVIDDWGLGFCLGNAVKYILRAPHKGTERQDLEKARWYLEHWISTETDQHDFYTDTLARALPPRCPPEAVAADWHLGSDLTEALESIYGRGILTAVIYLNEHISNLPTAAAAVADRPKRCRRCGKPVAYAGGIYCGAACSVHADADT